MRALGALILLLVFLFLLGPFLVIVAAGLSAGETLAFPPEGLSLRWYAHVFAVPEFRTSFLLSLGLGLAATAAALVLGVPVAYALSRYDVPAAEAIRTLVTTPIIVPGIIVGLALFRHVVIASNLPVTAALFLAHTALLIPYAVRVVSASLENLRADIEEAAVLLGASRLGAFFSVVMPNIRSGLVAAFILGFVTSFNQVPVSLFLTGPGTATLPIQMLWYMEFSFDPSIAALSALLAVFSIILVLGAERTLGLSRYV
jgi:putative spermidine/putrescine transport system permease protein